MEKNKEFEGSEPSRYDYFPDFNIDLRLKPYEYLLIIPYLLIIMLFVWSCELCVDLYHKLMSHKSNFKNKIDSDSNYNFNALAGPCCLWPKHSAV